MWMKEVRGHGALESVNRQSNDGSYGSRNWQVHKLMHGTLREWNPYSLNGVDGRTDNTDYPCGEPGQTITGEKTSHFYESVSRSSADEPWTVPGIFAAETTIEFDVKVTANHGGIFEFRYMCADGMNDIEYLDFYDEDATLTTSAACFADNRESNIWRDTGARTGCFKPRNLVRAANSGKTFLPSRPEWYILTQNEALFENYIGERSDKYLAMEYTLPASLATCQHAIIQWWWQTSNGCIFPSWRDARDDGTFPYADEDNWPSTFSAP